MYDVNPLGAKHDYSHFYFVLSADYIIVIGNEMGVLTIRFTNVWFPIKQI